jgi:hypothetical protein
MSARSFVACLLAAFSLVLPAALAAGPPEECPGRLVTRVYPVADLVVPLDQPCSKRGPVQTQERKLIELLASTVQPRTWSEVGGPGTIDYFPLTMSLIVHQTPDVQEQIQELLTALRKLQDVEVTVELRFLTVSEAMREQLMSCAPQQTTPGVAVLDDTQLRMLLEIVQSDSRTNIMQAPKVTMFNGQRASVDLTEKKAIVVGVDFEEKGATRLPVTKTKVVSTGLQFSLLPTVSPDNKMVTLQLAINAARIDQPRTPAPGAPVAVAVQRDDKGEPVLVTAVLPEPQLSTVSVEKTLKLADGATALLSGWTQQREMRWESCPLVLQKVPYLSRVFRTVGYTKETEHTLVLVTPRIVVRHEEEEKAPAPREVAAEAGADEADAHPAPTYADAVGVRYAGQEAAVPAPEERAKGPEVMYVNKRSFQLTYEVENVGRSKLRGIDVWWSHEDRHWRRHAAEAKPTGAVPVRVQSEGRYGFTLVPRSGAGRAAEGPRQGDEPQVWVEVDQTPPAVEVHAVKVGGEPDRPTARIGWRVTDRNLGPRPVRVRYAERPDGPWTDLGEEFPAAGCHEIDARELPFAFYLQVEAVDLAGNVGVATTPAPVKVDPEVPVIRKVKVSTREAGY